MFRKFDIESVDNLLQEMVKTKYGNNGFKYCSQVSKVVGSENIPGTIENAVLAPKPKTLPCKPHRKENTWYTKAVIVFFLHHPQMGNNDTVKTSLISSVPQGKINCENFKQWVL